MVPAAPPARTSVTGPFGGPIPWAALVFVATLAFYLPADGVRFLNWDDDVRVVGDASIRGLDADHLYAMATGFSVANYTPIERLSCALDHAFWGPDPWGFRFTNALFHAANAALWFLLSLHLFALGGVAGARALAAAVVSALAFAFHPLRVESVAWISERRDVLSLFWSLLAVLLYLRRFGDPAAERRARWVGAASWACFLCAVLSKASAVTLPVVLCLLDAFPLRRFGPGNWRGIGRCLVEKGPWFAVAGFAGAIALVGQQAQAALVPLGAYPFGPRVLHACLGLATWCARWVVPVDLGPYYPPFAAMPGGARGASWLALSWVCVVSLGVARGFSRRPALAVAWFSFLAMALPFSGLVQAGGAGVPDRYTYMAMLPAALLAGGLVLLPEGRAARVAAFVALGGILSLWALGARHLIPAWNDSRALWMRGVATAPGCAIPLANLASALLDAGEPSLARVVAREAVRVGPELPLGHASLAQAALQQRRWAEAAAELEAVLRVRPGDAAAHAHLALLPSKGAGKKQATSHAFATVQCGGGTEAEVNLAILLAGMGQERLAGKYLRRAADDGSARASLALAAFHEGRGDFREAVGALRRGYERTGDRALLREAWRVLRAWRALPASGAKTP